MLFTFTQADANPEQLRTLLELEDDDTLYLAHVTALVSETSSAQGNANVLFSWHDADSLALNPDIPLQKIMPITIGAFAQSRLYSMDFQFRLTNPGVLKAGVFDMTDPFSIDFRVDLCKVPIVG